MASYCNTLGLDPFTRLPNFSNAWRRQAFSGAWLTIISHAKPVCHTWCWVLTLFWRTRSPTFYSFYLDMILRERVFHTGVDVCDLSGLTAGKAIRRWASLIRFPQFGFLSLTHEIEARSIPGVSKKAEQRIFSTLRAKNVISFDIIS